MDANPGDLVVCVEGSRVSDDPTEVGRVYRVKRAYLRFGIPFYALCGVFEWKDAPGCLQQRFRKIDHDKPEACEAEFVTLLERAKCPVSA